MARDIVPTAAAVFHAVEVKLRFAGEIAVFYPLKINPKSKIKVKSQNENAKTMYLYPPLNSRCLKR